MENKKILPLFKKIIKLKKIINNEKFHINNKNKK